MQQIISNKYYYTKQLVFIKNIPAFVFYYNDIWLLRQSSDKDNILSLNSKKLIEITIRNKTERKNKVDIPFEE
jgi:hypothetical protein